MPGLLLQDKDVPADVTLPPPEPSLATGVVGSGNWPKDGEFNLTAPWRSCMFACPLASGTERATAGSCGALQCRVTRRGRSLGLEQRARAAVSRRALTAGWCNGNTPGSGPGIEGSSPSPAATWRQMASPTTKRERLWRYRLARSGRRPLKAEARVQISLALPCYRQPKWRNGRRRGLKILQGKPCAGSTPAFGTTPKFNRINVKPVNLASSAVKPRRLRYAWKNRGVAALLLQV